jgi:hypothetical protein
MSQYDCAVRLFMHAMQGMLGLMPLAHVSVSQEVQSPIINLTEIDIEFDLCNALQPKNTEIKTS